jgi:hypothetical protein
MITIHNLTHKQKLLLDVMWELDTMEKVQQFIHTLPKQDAQDAHSLLQIAIWESIEQESGLNDYAQDSLAVISRVRSSR